MVLKNNRHSGSTVGISPISNWSPKCNYLKAYTAQILELVSFNELYLISLEAKHVVWQAFKKTPLIKSV